MASTASVLDLQEGDKAQVFQVGGSAAGRVLVGVLIRCVGTSTPAWGLSTQTHLGRWAHGCLYSVPHGQRLPRLSAWPLIKPPFTSQGGNYLDLHKMLGISSGTEVRGRLMITAIRPLQSRLVRTQLRASGNQPGCLPVTSLSGP